MHIIINSSTTLKLYTPVHVHITSRVSNSLFSQSFFERTVETLSPGTYLGQTFGFSCSLDRDITNDNHNDQTECTSVWVYIRQCKDIISVSIFQCLHPDSAQKPGMESYCCHYNLLLCKIARCQTYREICEELWDSRVCVCVFFLLEENDIFFIDWKKMITRGLKRINPNMYSFSHFLPPLATRRSN